MGICSESRFSPDGPPVEEPSEPLERLLWISRRLASGDGGAEAALRTLRRELLTRRPSPRLLSDLGALELVLAASQGRPSHLVKALESCERALSAEPGIEEASFNRALALEALGLQEQALSAWSHYLELDNSSGWAKEAQQRRSRLQELIAKSRYREDLPMTILRIVAERDGTAAEVLTGHQETVWAHVLSSGFRPWAEAIVEHGKAEKGTVVAMKWLADLLARAAGDTALVDIVDHVAGAEETELDAYARSVLTYSGLRHGEPYSQCEATLEDVERTFRRLDSPLRLWVAVDRAICDFFDKDFAASRARLADVRRTAVEENYRWLIGRAAWIEGLVMLRQGDLERSLDSLSAARETMLAVGDLSSSAYMDALIAKNLQHVGRREGSWFHRVRALRAAAKSMTSERRFTVYEEVTELLDRTGPPAAALYFASAQLQAAEDAASRNPALGDLPIFALLKRADLARRRGAADAAERSVRRAKSRFRELSSSNPNWKRIARAIEVHEALLNPDVEAIQQALVAAEKALGGTLSSPGDRLELTRLGQLRGAVLEQAGHIEEAIRVYASVFSEAERQRSLLTDVELRAKNFAFLREVNEDLVLALIASGEVEDALCSANRLRFLTSLHRAAVSPPGCARLLASLPQPTVLIAALTEKLVLFTFNGGEIAVETKPVTRSGLVQMVADFTAALRSESSDAEAMSEELGRLILPESIRSIGRHSLPEGVVLCPDPELAALPFSALKLRDGRYLIDETPVSVALWLDGSPPSRSPGTVGSEVILIGDPRVGLSRGFFPPLPGATEEVAALDRIYRDAGWTTTIIEQQKATETTFRAALLEADVLHYAGHSIAVASDPFQSAVVLSDSDEKDRRSDGLLTVREVAELDLDGPWVVVLSSCDSAVGVEPESADIVSLGGGFRGAGVPNVVASLWPLDDRQTIALQRRFHRELAAGLAPPVALARAQRMAREMGLGASIWASLSLFRAA